MVELQFLQNYGWLIVRITTFLGETTSTVLRAIGAVSRDEAERVLTNYKH